MPCREHAIKKERERGMNGGRRKKESREERVGKTGRWVLEEIMKEEVMEVRKEREELPDEIILQLKISLLIQQRCNKS